MTIAHPPPPRPAATRTQAAAPVRSASFEIVRTPGGKVSPPRILFSGVEGWGKTTLAAHAPSPLVIMVGEETGYDTIHEAGLVPTVARVKVSEWSQMLALLDSLRQDQSGIRTIAIDALGGLERMCHEMVCQRDFGGDWGEKGFGGFHRGYDMAIAEIGNVVRRLEDLRSIGMATIILSHIRVSTFKNPEGPDFDRYTPDCHHKTWGVLAKWCDVVALAKYRTVVDGAKIGRKGKAIGGHDRIVHVEQSDALVAKNRYGMPPIIEIGDDPAQSWSTFSSHIPHYSTENQ